MEYRLKSIAFPNISTGVYGFPKALAAKIALETVKKFLEKTQVSLELIFVLFDHENETLYRTLLES